MQSIPLYLRPLFITMNIDSTIWILSIPTLIISFYNSILIYAFSRSKLSQQHLQPMAASIVVAARNEFSNLESLIKNLSAQDHPNFEIIIVNDRSFDGTFDLLNELKEKYSLIKVLNIEHKPDHLDGKKYALTLGIKSAKNEIIVLTDADCLPKSNQWLSRMTSPFNDSNIMFNLGLSLYNKRKGIISAFTQFETLWVAIQYIGMALLANPYMGVGRNLAYRKEVFLKNKGFDGFNHITGGDDDLFVNKYATSNNTTVTIDKESIIYTEPKKSLVEYVKQKTRHLSVGKHYKLKDKMILGVIQLMLFLFWIILISLFVYGFVWQGIALFSIRTMFLYLTFIRVSKKFGADFNLWGLVFLDFIYVFYYLSTGVRALFTKRVGWS